MQVFQEQCESISKLTGALDINTVDELRGILLVYLERNATIVVDLSSVTSCDAAGVQLLFALKKSAESAGKSFALAATSEALVRDCANLGINLALSMPLCASANLVGEMCNA